MSRLAVMLIGLCGCMSVKVTRVYDGIPLAERYIRPTAYAAYTRAAELEASKQDDRALQYYRVAAAYDDQSVEAWVRVGEVSCRLRHAALSDSAFDRAHRLNGSYAPLWAARARCHAKHGRTAAALQAARRAFELAPDEENVVLLVGHLAANDAHALILMIELVIVAPSSQVAWRHMLRVAGGAGDRGWQQRAQARLAQLKSRRRQPMVRSLDRVEQALRQGDVHRARRLAREMHLDPHVLPALAILVGKPKLALREAKLRLAADPFDSDGRIVFALASDLSGEPFGDAMTRLPADADAVSQIGRWMMAELLLRHVGRAAALQWIEGTTGARKTEPHTVVNRLRSRVATGKDTK